MQSSEKANELRKKQTDAEMALWRQLRNRSLFGCKFRRQFPIGWYIVDFVSVEAKLVIELDGGQHAERVAYDTARDRSLRKQGFEVLRFWNCDVFENLDGVLTAIAEALAKRGICACPHPTPLPEGEGVQKEASLRSAACSIENDK
jgi:very-short-patch-repair endonuclease